MELDYIAREIRSYEGLTRKRHIGAAIHAFAGFQGGRGQVLASFGEDAAVLDLGDGRVSLLAADGIWGRIVGRDPWWAGYCAVLVNVNDILAMGARPVAMVDVLSSSSAEFCREVGRGLAAGVAKFGVPLVGGHVHPDTDYDAVTVAVLGEGTRDGIMYSPGQATESWWRWTWMVGATRGSA
ncbi:MAG: hypothetical protein GXO65_07060 [Euryarchaeota archaeon]|nr:hypothetical protein [Euryarchaeota archaeon]